MEALLKKCSYIKETKLGQIITPSEKAKLKPDQLGLLNELRYYDINDAAVATKKEKAYILTGEHPREMIAPEIVFKFMNNICNKGTPNNL